MLSKLHDRLGTAGFVVAIVALVAALTGTAIAAGGLTAQQEKQVTKIAKKFAGKKGAKGDKGDTGGPGATGPAGAAGAAGAKGDAGAAGPTGPTGKGTTGVTGPAGSTGTTGVTGVTGTTGATGPSCPVGQCFLPSNSTETGVWSAAFPGAETNASISFSLPLKAPIDLAHRKIITAAAPAECDDGAGEAPSAANPEADPGYLCVWVVAVEPSGSVADVANPTNFSSGASKTGAIVLLTGGAVGSSGVGTWAVTAP